MKITFDWLKENNYPSVTDYCRVLAQDAENHHLKIEVYRGDMLCLIVNDIVETAKIMPTDSGFKKYDPTKRGKVRKASLEVH